MLVLVSFFGGAWEKRAGLWSEVEELSHWSGLGILISCY